MFKLIAVFAAGFYFGRNQQATQQVVSAGRQLLDATTDKLRTQPVLPDTRIISPEQANNCKRGYTWWPAYERCLSPEEDAAARERYAKTGTY